MPPLSRLKGMGVIAALLWASLWMVHAEAWQSTELNFEIDLPMERGWTREALPEGDPRVESVKVCVRSPESSTVLYVFAADIDPSKPADEFLEKTKSLYFEKSRSRNRSEEQLEIDGHPGCRLQDVVALGGEEVHRVNTMVIRGGRMYQVIAMGFGFDPWENPTVRETVASFRFLGRTPLPGAWSASTDRADILTDRITDITLGLLVGIPLAVVLLKEIKRRPLKRA